MANHCTKFEVSSLSCSRDTSGGYDHAHFRNNLSSVCWDLLQSTHTPNLGSLCSSTTKIWKAMQNVEIRAVWGHPRSPAMSPFDRVNTTFYLTSIETVCLSCTVFEL